MSYHYADLTRGQESPELMPNELALALSKAIGYDHFLVHQALVLMNPEVQMQNYRPTLSPVNAAQVLQRVDQSLNERFREMVTVSEKKTSDKPEDTADTYVKAA